MKLNKKGITLIELLAAVTVLGILSVLAVTGVSSLLARSRENYYKATEEQIKLAAESYAQQNRNKLPKSTIPPDNKTQITILELVAKKYINSPKDHTGKNCSNVDIDNTKVTITKVSKTKYSYTVTFECNGYS